MVPLSSEQQVGRSDGPAAPLRALLGLNWPALLAVWSCLVAAGSVVATSAVYLTRYTDRIESLTQAQATNAQTVAALTLRLDTLSTRIGDTEYRIRDIDEWHADQAATDKDTADKLEHIRTDMNAMATNIARNTEQALFLLGRRK